MAIETQDVLAFLKKYPVAIGCGVLSIGLLAGSYLRSSTEEDFVAQVKQKDEEGKRIFANITSGTNVGEQLEAIKANTKDLESRLVRGSDRLRNQQYFYRLESDTGVKEVVLQAGAVNTGSAKGPKTLYCGIGYSITVQGSYRQILDFLGRLETGQHFYRLNSASVSRVAQRSAPEATSLLTLTANLELLGLQ